MAGANEFSMKICKIGRRGLPLQCKGVMLIGAKLPLARTMCAILGVACLLLTGCYAETYDVEETSEFNGTTHVVLTFVTPNNSSSRSAMEDRDGYEAGIDYEDDINISAGDYKIYFFSYESGDEKGGTLIAEFKPTEITQSSTSSTTTYTMIGDVPNELLDVSNFRVVMLANWGVQYPSVTAGTTTIDDLVEGTYTTFNASTKFTINESNLIPFYGVQEYTGITFTIGSTTNLSTPASLLRAMAKVEVILEEGGDIEAFDDVSIVNYNSQGYCAPAGVYTAEDYDTQMNNNPSSDNWADEWVKDLHLVNGKNDTDSKTQAFTQITGASQDTWRIYVPEYDNVSNTNDYSYITLTIGDTPYYIYFAEYTDGATDNSILTNRYNLKRNNIYRFYVTILLEEEEYKIVIRVWAEKWEELFDNSYEFGGDDDGNNDEPDDGDDNP